MTPDVPAFDEHGLPVVFTEFTNIEWQGHRLEVYHTVVGQARCVELRVTHKWAEANSFLYPSNRRVAKLCDDGLRDEREYKIASVVQSGERQHSYRDVDDVIRGICLC